MSELWGKIRGAAFITKPKGLSEINHRHPKYRLMLTIRYLLRHHLPDTKSRSVLDRTDYVHHVTMAVNDATLDASSEESPALVRRPSVASVAFAGKLRQDLIKGETNFTVYAPTVFATLRAALGISHEDFLMSVAPDEEIGSPYLQFTSNSKGKDAFFFTCDRRFVLKQEKHQTISKFMELLEEYLGHFITSPHSLIAKILGAFCVKMKNIEPVYFIVVQSIFWPSSRIEERYDIKGCLGGRFEDPAAGPNVAIDSLVYKDQNFLGTPISLGKERAWFIEQIHRDVRFLQRLQMMDYSLLIGIQSKMHDHESSGQTLSSFVSSVKRSSLSFGEKPILNFKSGADESHDFQQTDIFHWVLRTAEGSPTDRPPQARPESNLSLLNDVFQDELSALAETGAVRKPLLSALKSSRKRNVTKVVRQVRFDESQLNPKDESPFVQVVPALSGIVSPVPSVHFQVHEPPTSQNDFCEECYNINEASVKSSLKSPLKRRNKTHPLMDQPNLESSDEIWYTHESRNKISVVGLLHRMSGKKMVSNTMKRAKGYWSDLDRIEVASPLAANDAPEKRRHSLVLHQWMQAWQNLNGCENRRLLPDCENGVHIMDGVSHRYYIGIIDIFTEYTIKQKIGRIFKSLIFCSSNHSSVPPDEYATRFVDFIEEHLVH